MHCYRCHDKNFLADCACGCKAVIFQRYRTKGDNHKRRYIKGHQSRGRLHYDYKGWTFGKKGYIMQFVPDHHFANPNGYVAQHRIVWEKAMKACLLPWAAVHHINGIKDDNRLKNLHAMMSRQHKSLHAHGRMKDMSGRRCRRCGRTQGVVNAQGYTVWCRHPVTKEEWYCPNCCNTIKKRLRKKGAP